MSIALTADNFELEVMKSDIPVLVDFWAQWCGPCRVVAPIIDELAQEYKGKIKVCKLNVDDAAQIAARFGVMSIPTLIFFNKSKVVKQITGAMPKEQLVEEMARLFGKI
ncbi:MAG: thioredoxin [Candidatus Omnitrophica bacterium]|nr:thioredoxin [Candidatus Omnitrophota bacterium]